VLLSYRSSAASCVLLILLLSSLFFRLFFFFTDTAPTEIYTLSLHDALPICSAVSVGWRSASVFGTISPNTTDTIVSEISTVALRSEEHTSELQSLRHLVCRLLLEKKKKKTKIKSKT